MTHSGGIKTNIIWHKPWYPNKKSWHSVECSPRACGGGKFSKLRPLLQWSRHFQVCRTLRKVRSDLRLLHISLMHQMGHASFDLIGTNGFAGEGGGWKIFWQIGSSDCSVLLWLVGVIILLSVFRQSFENSSECRLLVQGRTGEKRGSPNTMTSQDYVTCSIRVFFCMGGKIPVFWNICIWDTILDLIIRIQPVKEQGYSTVYSLYVVEIQLISLKKLLQSFEWDSCLKKNETSKCLWSSLEPFSVTISVWFPWKLRTKTLCVTKTNMQMSCKRWKFSALKSSCQNIVTGFQIIGKVAWKGAPFRRSRPLFDFPLLFTYKRLDWSKFIW